MIKYKNENDSESEKGYLEKPKGDILNSENVNKRTFDDEKKKDWISMVDKLDKEYIHVIDVKKELDTSLEKMINVKTLKSYQVSVPRKERTDGLKAIIGMENETRYDNNKRKRWCRFLCCKKKNINHSYDEEDVNHIEDRRETEKVNDDQSKIETNYKEYKGENNTYMNKFYNSETESELDDMP